MTESTFDPRYDPAFQRGYVPRPQNPGQAVVSPVSPDDLADPQRPVPGRRSAARPAFAMPDASVAPPAPRVAAPVPQQQQTPPAEQPAEPEPTDAAEPEPEREAEEDIRRPFVRELLNPFVWVLIVGGALLAIWGRESYFDAYRRQSQLQFNQDTQAELESLWAVIQFAPTLFGAGLVIAAAGLVVLAMRWRR